MGDIFQSIWYGLSHLIHKTPEKTSCLAVLKIWKLEKFQDGG
jgi:hypothetical protein